MAGESEWQLEMDSGGDLELFFGDGNDIEFGMSKPIIHGTDDYNELRNKPIVNGVTVVGNMSIVDILNGQWLCLNGMTSEERIGADT